MRQARGATGISSADSFRPAQQEGRVSSVNEPKPGQDPDVTEQFVEEHRRIRRLLSEIPEVENELYGKLLAPKDPAQMLTLLGVLASLQIGAWRGQGNLDWTIDSALARRYRGRRAWLGPRYKLSEKNLRAVEKTLVERTRAAALADGMGELELLARLQHHGAATRLLDCSRSAFVALWFACESELEADGLLIGFRLEEHAIHLTTEKLEQSIDTLNDEANGKLSWWQPRGLSPRISAQQAVFVFGPVVDEPWGSIRLGSGEVDVGDTGNVPGAALVLVTKQLKASFNEAWRELFGFSRESLFPDFDGFAQAHGVAEEFPYDFPLGG